MNFSYGEWLSSYLSPFIPGPVVSALAVVGVALGVDLLPWEIQVRQEYQQPLAAFVKAAELEGCGRRYLYGTGAEIYTAADVREAYEEARDWPPLCTHYAFPWTREQVREEMSRNRETFHYLEVFGEVWPGERYVCELWRDKLTELFWVWDLLEDTKLESFSVFLRRKKLAQLRDRIGVNNFSAGLMPDAVPPNVFSRRYRD